MNNLLANALKYTDEGIVTVRAKQINTTHANAIVLISVEDTGIGISPEKQQVIFDSFTQVHSDSKRQYGGTGLGLAISKRIVELFGGSLELESAAGKGSCFYFTCELALNIAGSTFVSPQTVRGLQSLKGLRVLIAEDNAVNMMVTRKFLQRWDIHIAEAANGREAVALFTKDRFDLLLIDLEMPDMDGYEALHIIRSIDPHIPAIAFTAAVFENMHLHLTEQGFSDYIQKPFRPDELHRKLSQALLA
jgi:CheY-like chemotaxis protein